jgi:phenylacetate-CoA ligase
MDLYKNICKHIVIPLWAAWEHSPYLKHLKYLEQSQYFSKAKIREIQWGKIKRILDHAYKNCSYYRRKFNSEGIHPEDIKSFDDFLSIPILKKNDVHKYREDLIAPNVDKYKSFLTSGSTGKPLRGYINKESSEFRRACGRRSEFWAGYDLGERIYVLYGNPEKELRGLKKFSVKFRRKALQRTEVLDMLRLSEESMLKFAHKMQKKPPSLLWGHAHGLYLLAKFLEKKGLDDIRPKGMYSAGMVLHDFERKKVEEIFKCKLQDRYGTEELGLIATECKEKEGLHINTDCHYLEFIGNDGKPVPPGERGFIIVTDLTNLAMPFIRYRTEDVGIPSTKKCSCGRTQPLIEKIQGRIADFLITPEGELISGVSLTDHFAGQIPGVAQMQIVQEKIDRLTLNIVRNDDFGDESKQKVSHLVREFFGGKMYFQYNFVNQISQGPSGKYRFTICKVDHELLKK